MQLQAGNLAEILDSLRSDRNIGDRRRAPRVGLRARVAMSVEDEAGRESIFGVWIRNISATGVGLLHDRPMNAGESFRIWIPTQDGVFLRLPCQAVHSQPAGNNFHRIGAKFTGEPTHARASSEGAPVPSPAETNAQLDRLRKLVGKPAPNKG